MKILVIIPARGGSKGLPGKNIKKLRGKPLIAYTIDVARQLVSDQDICVSTNDQSIIDVVENYGLKVPFIRPEHLAVDNSSTNDVLIHAYNHYLDKGKVYDVILLLQPTSPLRNISHVKEAIALYTPDLDMVVSVKKSHAASVICNEDSNGFLNLSINRTLAPRQYFDSFYEYNGAIYVINPKSLLLKSIGCFNKVVKYLMLDKYSIDIDTIYDWYLADAILSEK